MMRHVTDGYSDCRLKTMVLMVMVLVMTRDYGDWWLMVSGPRDEARMVKNGDC